MDTIIFACVLVLMATVYEMKQYFRIKKLESDVLICFKIAHKKSLAPNEKNI